jgi:predicted metal-dependent hydrolase
MIKFLKHLLILAIMPFYIAFGLPHSFLVAIRFFIPSIPKTWQALAARLIGPRKQSEAKELEEQHANLLQEMLKKEATEILQKIVREAAEKARREGRVDWNKVAYTSNKWGNG